MNFVGKDLEESGEKWHLRASPIRLPGNRGSGKVIGKLCAGVTN